MKRVFLFLLFVLIIFGLTYLFKWNLYYLFLNPFFIIILFFFLLTLSLLFKFPLKFSIFLSLLLLLSLFALNQYLLKVEIEKGPPFSETIIEKVGKEKEFYGNLLLTEGSLTIKGTRGENLFMFDYYAPVKLKETYNIKNNRGEFKVLEAGSLFERYQKNEYKFYVNSEIKTKIFIKGKTLSLKGDLVDTLVNELDIKGKVFYLDIKLGEKGKVFKLSSSSTSLMGEIEIPDGFYVEVRIYGSYLTSLPENFKEIKRGFYVREGDNGRIYINVKSKGCILTIKEESND